MKRRKDNTTEPPSPTASGVPKSIESPPSESVAEPAWWNFSLSSADMDDSAMLKDLHKRLSERRREAAEAFELYSPPQGEGKAGGWKTFGSWKELVSELKARKKSGAEGFSIRALVQAPIYPRDLRDHGMSLRKFTAPGDELGILDFGRAWPAIKRLKGTINPIEREELIDLLRYRHPEAAGKLGLAPVESGDRQAPTKVPEAIFIVLKRYPDLPNLELCRRLDAYNDSYPNTMPIPKSWKLKGAETWVSAYQNKALKGSVKTYFSKARRALQVQPPNPTTQAGF